MHKKIIFGLIIVLIGLFFLTLSIVKQSAQITIKPVTKPLIESKAIKLPTDESEIIFGNPGASITVAEFFSFECEDCAKLHKEIVGLVSQNPKNVRLVTQAVAKENWLGNIDVLPLVALSCANEQNKYWDFLDKTIQLKKVDEKILKQTAIELNLEMTFFNNCLQQEQRKTTIIKEQTALKVSGFNETPLIFIDNKKINLTDDVKLTDILKSRLAE